MGKLVRDRIPEIIRARGGTAIARTLDAESFRAELLNKLLEEAAELRDAPADSVLDETADVYEVLLAIVSLEGTTLEQVAERADAKRAERGSFTDRTYLESYT